MAHPDIQPLYNAVQQMDANNWITKMANLLLKFTAAPGESFEDFLVQFNNVLTAAEVSEDRALRSFPLHLSGRAFEVYNMLPENIKFHEGYMRMLDEYKVALNMPLYAELSREMLDNLEKDRKESIRDYATRVKRLVRAAYPDMTPEQQTKECVRAFIAKLPRELKVAVKRRDPANWDDALRIAEQETQLQRADQTEVNAVTEELKKISLLEKIHTLSEKLSAQENKQRQLEQQLRNTREQGRPSNGRGNFNNNHYNNRGNYNRGRGNNFRGNRPFRGQYQRGRGSFNSHGNGVFAVHEDMNQVPSTSSSGRSSSPSSAMSAKYLFFVCMCLLVPSLSASAENRTRLLNDCRYTTTERAMIPPQVPDCTLPMDITAITSTFNVEVYGRKSVLHNCDMAMCTRHAFRVCTQGFMKMFSRTEVTEIEAKTLSAQECREMNNTLKFDGKQLEHSTHRSPSDNRFIAALDTNTTIPWFFSNCDDRFVYTVERGEIYATDEKTMTATVGEVSGCIAAEGECVKDNITNVWTPFHISANCMYEKLSEIRSAIKIGNNILFPEINTVEEISDSELSEKEKQCMGKNTFKLKSGLIVKTDHNVFTETRPKRLLDIFDIQHPLEKEFGRINETVALHEQLINDLLKRDGTSQRGLSNISQGLRMLQVAFEAEAKKADDTRKKWAELGHTDTRAREELGLLKTDVRRDGAEIAAIKEGIRVQTELWSSKMRTLERLFANNSTRSSIPLEGQDELEKQIIALTTKVAELNRTQQYQQNIGKILSPGETNEELLRETQNILSTLSELKREAALKEAEFQHLSTQVALLQSQRPSASIFSDSTSMETLPIMLKFMSTCLAQKSKIESVRALMISQPSLGMRQLLKRTDIVARPAGENVFMVSRCRQIEVKEQDIFKNFTFNGTCFDRWPIHVQGELLFLLPATSDMSYYARTIPCRNRKFQIDRTSEGWFYGDKMGPEPIYLDATKIALEVPQLESRKPRFAKSTIDWFKNVGHSIRNTTVTAVDEVISKVKRTAEKTGEFATKAYHKTKTVIVDTLSTLWDAAKWVFFFICLPLFGVAVIAGMIFLYCKIWFIRKSTSGISDSIKSLATLSPKIPRALASLSPKLPRLGRVNAVQFEDNELLERNPPNGYKPLPTTVSAAGRSVPLFTYIPIVMALVLPVVNSVEIPCGLRIPFIPIHMNGIPVVSLFDTGSSLTYCRLSTARKLGIEGSLSPSTRTARAANGTQIPFLGAADVLFSFGKNHIIHSILVSEDQGCPAAGLIGTDLMKKLSDKGHEIRMNFNKETITIGKEEIKLLNQGERGYDTGATFAVQTTEDITLEPRSDNVIFARTNVSCPNDLDLLIEGSNNQEEFMTGRTLCNPEEGNKVTVRLMNPQAKPVTIRKGTPIATAEVVLNHLYDVNVVYNVDRPTYVSPETDWERHLPEAPCPNKSFQQFAAEKMNLEKSVLSEKQKQELKKLVFKYKEAFVGPDGKIGHYKGKIQHKIPVKPDEPVVRRFYRVPLHQREEVDKQIQELIDQKIIRPSESEFCSPIVLVKKKEAGTWRFTVDYRGVNRVTRPTTYILPLIADIIDIAAGNAVYTTADMKSAYFQVDMVEEDIPKTAFATHTGLFEFVRMPMGLCGAPDTFQRIMEGVKRQIQAAALVYLDDIIIMSPDSQQHLKDLEEMFTILIKNGLKVRLDKTAFAQDKVKYLGYDISKAGIAVDPKKTEIIRNFPRPKSVTDVRSFIGMLNYFRRFISNFADIAAPLTELTRKETPFAWTETTETAFQKLKDTLMKAPVLRPPVPGKPFILETDASGVAIAAVLLQGDSPKEAHPVAFFSRRLNVHERRYAALEIEALAICAACEYFRQYIAGSKTLVVTDHRPLVSILQKKDLTGRLAKYQISIQEYQLEIIYRPGKQNSVADTLSRYPPAIEETSAAVVTDGNQNTNTTERPYIPSREEIIKDQQKCEWIQEKLQQLQIQSENNTEPYMAHNGVLYIKPEDQHEQPKVVIPEKSKLKTGIIWYFHNSAHLGAHMNWEKTWKVLDRAYHWTNSRKDTKEAITSCEKCQRRKTVAAHLTREPLGTLTTPSAPFERVHMDLCGPLPLTESGNKHILVMVCAFSKFAITVPMRTQKADETAKAVMEHLVTKHGVPECVVTDQGRNLISEVFVKMLEMMGCHRRTSTPYHHQSNGQVERFNRTLEEILTLFVNDSHDDWDDYLQLITFAYNAAPNSTTKFCPFEVLYGRAPLVPEDLGLPNPRWKYMDTEDYQDFLSRHLTAIWEKVHENIEISQARAKEHYDRKHGFKSIEIQEGEEVLLKKENPQNKLDFTWSGPYSVKRVIWPNIEIEDKKGKISMVHLNRVKKLRSQMEADENLEESADEDENEEETNA